jgi:hypothetical protein
MNGGELGTQLWVYLCQLLSNKVQWLTKQDVLSVSGRIPVTIFFSWDSETIYDNTLGSETWLIIFIVYYNMPILF